MRVVYLPILSNSLCWLNQRCAEKQLVKLMNHRNWGKGQFATGARGWPSGREVCLYPSGGRRQDAPVMQS
jgi:hypothetical protein